MTTGDLPFFAMTPFPRPSPLVVELVACPSSPLWDEERKPFPFATLDGLVIVIECPLAELGPGIDEGPASGETDSSESWSDSDFLMTELVISEAEFDLSILCLLRARSESAGFDSE